MESQTRIHKKRKFMNNIMDDIFHPDKPICQIIPTSTEKKKNYFKLFRPAPKANIDYIISQTDTKMDAGHTKIHIQETRAEYAPVSTQLSQQASTKKIRYFRGGPPQWEFLDEIWQRKQDELQIKYKIETKKLLRKRKQAEKCFLGKAHHQIVALAGPAWFQELSPDQIEVVDNLKNAISKDLNEGTIINTQETIASLGLVLRPNHRHVEKALKSCFKCPIEFLLILYQLINPKRQEYSVNDRILLSAVVHLTMQDTLKELHIRIPSPPPPPKVPKKVPKRKKQVKYDSPYLQPFSFEKEPQKFTGVYDGGHLRHPRSPYFCYLNELKTMKEQVCDFPALESIDGDEIEKELRLAQTMYEELVDFRPVPTLLKPSKYTPCHLIIRPNTSKNEETVKKDDEIKVDTPDEQVCDAETEITEELSVVANECSTQEPECSKEPPAVVNDQCPKGCSIQELERTNEEEKNCQKVAENVECAEDLAGEKPCENELIASTSCKEVDKVCYETTAEKTEVCYTAEAIPKRSSVCNDPESNAENKQIKCYQKDKTENVSDVCTSKPCNKTFESCPNALETKTEKKCKHVEQLDLYNKMYHVIRPSTEEKTPCKCKERYKKMTEAPFCQCERCLEERKQRNINFVISGLKETGFDDTVSIIDRVVTQKPCECLKKYQNTIREYEEEITREAKKPCGCYKKIKKAVETPFCQCERCQEDRRRKAARYIISGIKENNSEYFRIIEGISMGKPCECLKKYEKEIHKYEAFRNRKEALVSIKGQDQKYVIGGVVNTADGPFYIISGLRPPIDCSCAKKAREANAEKHMQTIMPRIPPGRVQYGIVGVKETPDGNIYILGDALPIEDCGCMTVLNSFERQHDNCNQLYEDYLSKMKNDCDNFVKEMLQFAEEQKPNEINQTDVDLEKPDSDLLVPLTSEETEEKSTCKEDATAETNLALENGEKAQVCERSQVAPCRNICAPICCTCGNPYYSECCNCGKIQEVECKQCSCGDQVIECVDCTCGAEEEEEEIVEEEEKILKRFFIFKKILHNEKWQRNLLKMALESMAEDGYPLAKLPECYKLPHFKLWMQMRCRVVWTKKQETDTILKSKSLWRHTDICTAWRMDRPELSISTKQAHLIDWSRADYCRKLVDECLDRFYRKIRQNRIHFGREFFPTTFSYEFPFKTWRSCYFAYTPVKEEEVHARFVWKKYEFKNFAEMQRFCRL